jgi:hypothetical protein
MCMNHHAGSLMPKYVFEVSLTLAADETLSVAECNAINAQLADTMESLATVFGKRGGRISASEPFEQVTGDWLPPDERGMIKVGPSRPIDL